MNVNMYKQYLQKMGHWTILRTITVSQNWNAGDVSCKCHASRAKPPLENDANHNSFSSMLLADETCCWKMMQTLGGWFRSHGKTDSCPDVDSVWEYYTKKKISHHWSRLSQTQKAENLTNVCLTSTSHLDFHVICIHFPACWSGPSVESNLQVLGQDETTETEFWRICRIENCIHCIPLQPFPRKKHQKTDPEQTKPIPPCFC